MYKQFILPALLVVFTSVAAIAQTGTLAAPAGTTQKKPQSSAQKSTPTTQQPSEVRTENNLPKGAKVEKRTGNQKGKAKGQGKNKAQGNANGHHKGETPGAEGSHSTGEKHRNGEHAEGEHHNGEKRQDNGTDMKKADPSKPAPKKGQTSTVKKGKKPAKPGTTTPSTTPNQRTGGQAPASSGN